MSASTASDVHYEPWDAAVNVDPYPMFDRIREEAPLVEAALWDHQTFSRIRHPYSAARGRGPLTRITD